MCRRSLFFIVLFFPFSVLSQDRHLRNAKEAIDEKDFKKANEKLNSYFAKKGETPPYYYVKYLFYKESATTTSEHDSAFRYFFQASEGLFGLDEKEEKEWCKEVGFCKNDLSEKENQLDTAIYRSYTKDPTMDLVNEFIAKYPLSKMLNEAKKLKSHLAFLAATRVHSEKAYADYLKEYPYESDVPEAKKRMWELGYTSAKNENTINSYKKFITKYPDSDLVKEAKEAITAIEWERTKSANTVPAYQDFIDRFPEALQVAEAQNKIWMLAWETTVSLNNKQAFLDYIEAYPQSPKREMAIGFIENFSWLETVADGTKEAYENFITLFPNSKNADAAIKELERIEWNTIQNVYQLKSIEDFLKKYPRTKFREEAIKLMEEIRTEVLPYFTRTRKYKLYAVYTKSFVSNQEYEMIKVLDGGLFIVKQNGKIGLIDKSGKVIITITYDCVEQLRPGIFKVVLSGKNGIFDETGNMLVNLNYYALDTLPGGLFLVVKAVDEGLKSGILDEKGKVLIDSKFDGLYFINANAFIAIENDVTFLVNRSGNRLGSLSFSKAEPVGSDRIIATVKNKQGVIDDKGNIVLPINYKSISSAGTNWFIATIADKKTAIYNWFGKEALAPTDSEVSHFTRDLFFLSRSNKGASDKNVTVYNAATRTVTNKLSFEEIRNLEEGMAAYKTNNQIGYIDSMGQVSIEPMDGDFMGIGDETGAEMDSQSFFENMNDLDFDCESINPFSDRFEYFFSLHKDGVEFSDGLAVFYTNDEHNLGYIDQKGKIVIPTIYNLASPFRNGIANVIAVDEEKPAIINKKGERLLEGYKIISFTKDNKFALLLDEETGSRYTLDLLTFNLNELPDGISNYIRFKRHSIGEYKGAYIYITQSGKMLMDNNIDFSDFEATHLIREAEKEFLAGNYDESISIYERALNFISKKGEALYGLAKSHIANGNKQNGRDYLDQLIELEPENALAYEERANLKYESMEYSEALQDYTLTLQFNENPGSVFYFKLAFCHSNEGNYNESIRYYTESLNLDADNYAAYNNRGVNFERLGDLSSALKDFSKAVNTSENADNESRGIYYNNRGRILYAMRRTSEACSDFQKAAAMGNVDAKNSLRNKCR